MKSFKTPTLQPRMKVFNREQAYAVHTAALEILERVGVKMEHPDALEMLSDAGGRVFDQDWIRLPSYLAEEAVRSAPGQIILYDQQGNPAMYLTDGNVYFGTGSDTTFTVDLESGGRRRTLLKDVAHFARLVDSLENLSFAMSMANPADVKNVDYIYVHAFAEMVKNCNKPLVFIADRYEDMVKIHEIASAVAGGEEMLKNRPFLLNYSEAISPLRFPEYVMDRLIFCAQKGIPICLPSGSNAGGGAPVTLAGAMAIGIAENLVGLIVHQLTAKGAPFLFGPNVSALDMKSTVVSYGCPEWSLTQAALADMRDEIYGLPIWSFAGASDSKTMDAQAGAEAMFSIVTAMLSRCNLVHDVGYLEYGNTSSMEMVTMANELIAMARYFTQGITVDKESLALDALQRVRDAGAKGIFLTDDHTFDNFEKALFFPSLLDRSRYDMWEAEGSKDLYKRCNEEARKRIQTHEPKSKNEDVMLQIEKIVRDLI